MHRQAIRPCLCLLAATLVLIVFVLPVRADWRWVPVSPWPAAGPLAAVATNDRAVVAVGPRDALLVSEDGVAWSLATAPVFADLRGVAVHADLGFVAVGDGGVVLASPDGREWSQLASPGDEDLVAVSCSQERIAVAAATGTIALSDDGGSSWRSVVIPEATRLIALATDGQSWVAIGNGVWRSDEGETWARVDKPDWTGPDPEDFPPFQDIIASDSDLILLTNLGLLNSRDGGWTWTFESVPQLDLNNAPHTRDPRWRLAYAEDALVVTAGDPSPFCGFPGDPFVAVRRDTGEWESHPGTGPGSSPMLRLGGWWLALPQDATLRPLVATVDFETWAPLASERPFVSQCFGRSIVGAATNLGQLMACSYTDHTGGSYCRRTRDLVNWKRSTGAPGDEEITLDWFQGRWLMLVYRTPTLWASPYGVEWSKITIPGLEHPRWRGLAVASGVLTMVGEDGERSAVATTTDLSNWQVRVENLPPLFRVVGVPERPTGPSGFVALAPGGVVAHSADGLSWTREVVPGAPDLIDIAASGGDFQTVVAVTRDGTVVFRDLYHGWGTTAVGDTGFAKIWSIDGNFIIGLSTGTILESGNGADWSAQPSPVGSVVAALQLGLQTVIVGSQGAIAARVLGPAHPRVAATSYLKVPVAAATDGLNGTLWSSDLYLANPDETWNTVTVSVGHLWPGLRTVLPPGAATTMADVVRTSGAAIPGLYPVSVAASGGLAAVSTISTPLAEGGMAQTVPALSWDELEGFPDPVLLPYLRETAAQRTNVGLYRDNAQPIGATLEIRDASGAELGRQALPAPGGREVTQYTQPTRWFTGDAVPCGRASLELAPGDNPTWTAWTSVVDNLTGDATFHLAQAPTDAPFIVAAAVHLDGAAETFWRTDLVLVNPGANDAQVVVTPLPAEGWTGTADPTPVTVPAGASLLLEDVADALWRARGAAALLVEPLAGSVAAASRTFTVGHQGGTYGQGIPPIDLASATAGPVWLPGIRENANHRSNLGLINAGDESTTVTVTLRHANGAVLKGLERDLPPRSLVQLNQPLADLPSSVSDGAAEVRVDSADGAVIVWASVVDNHTGDAVFVLGRPPAP